MFEFKRPRDTTHNSKDSLMWLTLERQRAQETHHAKSKDLLRMVFGCLAKQSSVTKRGPVHAEAQQNSVVKRGPVSADATPM